MSARLSVVPKVEWESEEASSRVQAREDSGIYRFEDWVPGARAPQKNEAFTRYGTLVRRISLRLLRALPRTMTVDDIVSAGWIGMSEAIRRRPSDMPEDQFEAYASYRIRGAILDYLRSLDPLSRRLRALARRLRSAERRIAQEQGRNAAEDELARELGLSLPELQKVRSEILEAGLESLDLADGYEAPSRELSPESLASRNEISERILSAMGSLPERLQVVLTLHYQHDSSLREIGEILGVTESRVCQLHGEAVEKIRLALAPKRRLGRAARAS